MKYPSAGCGYRNAIKSNYYSDQKSNIKLLRMLANARFNYFVPFVMLAFVLLNACSNTRRINSNAHTLLVNDTAISKGFVGISIYDPNNSKFLYRYNANHYFVPASNTKLFTLYAGLKYLGDSLVGLRYRQRGDSLYVLPTGDPTFLYSGFQKQPVAEFFEKNNLAVTINDTAFKTGKYGSGWAWDEYGESYMPERNALPVAGNNISISFKKELTTILPASGTQEYNLQVFPILRSATFLNTARSESLSFARREKENYFTFTYPLTKTEAQLYIPFVTNGVGSAIEILNIRYPTTSFSKTNILFAANEYKVLHTQPIDSLFKPMMHRSDNFFAEQTLLMAANEYLGYMDEAKLIDTLLKKDFSDIPFKPSWVDGSGLSRYNLFTPDDFIYILNKLKNEFGLARLKNILATGGEGTLKNYYLKDAGFIFAKTGTLSNNCALSGYLITKKGKLLLFSVLVNNYASGATPVRKAVEQFLENIRSRN